jgi:predicted acylesterase/phospholipase RssA
MPTKLRIMLSGGGVRGIFQVGALTEILASGRYEVDRVYGCSVGAIVAPFVAANRLELAAELMRGLRSIDDVIERRHALFGLVTLPDWTVVSALYAFLGMGVYSRIKMVDKVKPAFTAEEWALVQERCFVVAYDIVRDQQTWFTGADLEVGIVCSSALCLAVPPVPHAGGLFTDGGVVELFPVTHMDADDGFDGEYLFVDCDTRVAATDPVAAPTDGMSLMGLLTWAAAGRLATAELEHVERDMAAAGRVMHVIRPDVNRFAGAFDIDAAKNALAFEDGRAAGLRFLARTK